MKVIDLTKDRRSLDDVLSQAKHESVLIHSESGDDFLLEQADEFEKEVARLGASKSFDAFLKTRANETGDIPLADVRKKRRI